MRDPTTTEAKRSSRTLAAVVSPPLTEPAPCLKSPSLDIRRPIRGPALRVCGRSRLDITVAERQCSAAG